MVSTHYTATLLDLHNINPNLVFINQERLEVILGPCNYAKQPE